MAKITELALDTDGNRGFIDLGNDDRIVRLIYLPLLSLNESERYLILKNAISEGKALLVMTKLIRRLANTLKNPPENASELFISEQHLIDIQHNFIELFKIRDISDNLFTQNGFVTILYGWKEWGSHEDVTRWIDNNTLTDEGFIQFIKSFIHQSWSQKTGDRVPHQKKILKAPELEVFIDSNKTIKRLEKISKESMKLKNEADQLLFLLNNNEEL